jgi:non-homologous end joining protein Ku
LANGYTGGPNRHRADAKHIVQTLEPEAQGRADTHGREAARHRQRVNLMDALRKSLTDAGKRGASQPAKGKSAKR